MSEAKPNVKMPANWDDHADWDRFYNETLVAGEAERKCNGLQHLEGACNVARHLLNAGEDRVWIPGCGLSLLPGVCAFMGLKVWASDASSFAISLQHGRPPFAVITPAVLMRHGVDERSIRAMPRPGGELRFSVHDFRTPAEEGDFAAIFNVRSFQGLPYESSQKAARVHWEALKPGGTAFFATQNVQGAYRSEIEFALKRAGFHVPYHDVDQWYRQQLNSTGVEYVFVMGHPIARMKYPARLGEYMQKRNQKKLDRFVAEYAQRKEQERPHVESLLNDGVTKTAYVFYSTG